MRRPVVISMLAFVVLFILHHDFWNWSNANLVFGFIPVGLAYHAGYSIVVCIFWVLVTRYAWPHSIEKWADESDIGISSLNQEERRVTPESLSPGRD